MEERGWLGDDELVEEFERVASDVAGRLRPIPIDLEQLAYELDGPTDFDEGWMLEVATGRLWPRDPLGMAGSTSRRTSRIRMRSWPSSPWDLVPGTSNERQLGRARWWLADEGLRPTTSVDT